MWIALILLLLTAAPAAAEFDLAECYARPCPAQRLDCHWLCDERHRLEALRAKRQVDDPQAAPSPGFIGRATAAARRAAVGEQPKACGKGPHLLTIEQTECPAPTFLAPTDVWMRANGVRGYVYVWGTRDGKVCRTYEQEWTDFVECGGTPRGLEW